MLRRSQLFLFLVLLAASSASVRAAKVPSPRAAPSFSLPTPSGTVTLDSLRGKVVLVDFWASWCMPCRESFPWMAEIQQRYSKEGLEVVAVNLDKKREAADLFLSEFTAPFTVAFDPLGKTAEAFRVAAMPSSYLVDRQGEIVYVHEGYRGAEARQFEEHIKEALSK